MKTWYPEMIGQDVEEMSDPECVDFMSVSPYVSDIERENRVSGEDNGDSDSSSAETSTPSTPAVVIRLRRRYKKYVEHT
ncbi:hypothetical protein EB796_018740 [Bugula neritina]|uniref:Uncharacterized protein n=1 Tax=Bugula neritina TaxID=10212 RepID=A0A7J7J9Q3_BUGNE|nr:hypothetical protein EB796_018740 [Bugula neritina]